GWTGSVYFSDLVASSTKRARFAKQLAAFQDKYGFDGIDLDWEYPNGEAVGCNTVRANDAAHLLSFLKVLRSTIGSKKLITAAVSSAGFIGIDGEALTSGLGPYAKYLNYINLMTLNFLPPPYSGSWSETTAANSPLRTCLGDGSVEDAVSLWVKGGFPAKQILLGIPSYAISFTTTKQPLKTHKITSDGELYHSKLYQAWTSVTPKGSSSDSNANTTDVCGVTTSAYTGQWQYIDLINEGALSADGTTGQKGFTRHWDECTQTPFLYHYHRRQLISYDDAKSAGVKAEYAREKGLGGV
ncbi:glycoside hydrolase superfamily, partial [Leucosporidium creatinivorum]